MKIALIAAIVLLSVMALPIVLIGFYLIFRMYQEIWSTCIDWLKERFQK